MSAIDLLKQIYELIGKFLENDVKETPSPAQKNNPFTIRGNVLYQNGTPVSYYSTTKQGGTFKGPRFIINHYTANNSLMNTVNIFKNHSASAHLIVGRDGEVVQMVPFNKRAWHAGKSKAKSKWGTSYSGLNSYSIGIEFVNYGYYRNGLSGNPEWEEAVHKNEGFVRKWQPYTDEQLEVAYQLNEAISKHYDIPAEHILGHDDISPDRKVDPGPLFPIDQIRSKLGSRK